MESQDFKDLYSHLIVLYVEDCKEVRETTQRTLLKIFNKVDVANDGKTGLKKYRDFFESNKKSYDLVISDIQMPYMNGIQMCEDILKINDNQKILITSAYDDKEYLKELINIGVKGFIQKPFSSKEFFEVLNNVCQALKKESILYLTESYKYDTFYKILYKNDEKIELSKNELNTLDLFVSNRNVFFKAEDIHSHIYFDEPTKDFSSDSIKSLLKRLRKKLPPDLIKNQNGIGYRLYF